MQNLFWITLRRLLYHDKTQLAMLDTRYQKKTDSVSYSNVTSKPKINNVELSGNKTASDLSLVASSEKGAAGGVAVLDANGMIVSAQLPSYVDDVVEGYYFESAFYEDDQHTIGITPETSKIYLDISTNKAYRFGSTSYVEISSSLALGETSSTAYAGDKGKANADAIGTLASLETTTKTDLVSAINEVNNAKADASTVGSLSNLNTTDKTSIVDAINEAASTGGLPAGGSTGQILAKASATDNDAEWINHTKIVEITQSAFDALSAAQKDDGTVYCITDAGQPATGNAATNQVAIMPTAGVEYLGMIFQYVGGNDGNYTTGYFYKCVVNDSVYSWKNVPVQPEGSSLELGETNTTAYAGSKGKANADAIGTLSGLNTTNKTNLVSAINEVNTAAGQIVSVPNGGSTNQVLAKNSATNGDLKWITPTVSVTKTTLWTGSISSANQTASLSDYCYNYDFIIIQFKDSANPPGYQDIWFIPENIIKWVGLYGNRWCTFNSIYTNSITILNSGELNGSVMVKVIGIKFK